MSFLGDRRSSKNKRYCNKQHETNQGIVILKDLGPIRRIMIAEMDSRKHQCDLQVAYLHNVIYFTQRILMKFGTLHDII